MKYYRKVIRIRAQDSPNVRLAESQIARGEEPTNEVIVPGVLSYEEYAKRRKLWDKVQQCVSLDADFYKGALNFLFTQETLHECKLEAIRLKSFKRRAKTIGIDAAEGGDDTVWTVIDELGVIYQEAQKTEDTADIPGRTIALMKEYRVEAENVLFDRGGGGKQHADQLRTKGYDVRTIGFGEGAKDPFKERKRSTVKPPVTERVIQGETGYAFKNRRAEMYVLASIKCLSGFGLPVRYNELIRQLGAMPKKYDAEGRLFLPPKNKTSPKFSGETIYSILGRSPDHADSFVLAIYGMMRKPVKVRVGVF